MNFRGKYSEGSNYYFGDDSNDNMFKDIDTTKIDDINRQINTITALFDNMSQKLMQLQNTPRYMDVIKQEFKILHDQLLDIQDHVDEFIADTISSPYDQMG